MYEIFVLNLYFFQLILFSLALYDADKKAHEEAIRNGGVSYFLRISVSL